MISAQEAEIAGLMKRAEGDHRFQMRVIIGVVALATGYEAFRWLVGSPPGLREGYKIFGLLLMSLGLILILHWLYQIYLVLLRIARKG